MRRLVLIAALILVGGSAHAAAFYGFAAGAFVRGPAAQVPDVIGLSQAAADSAFISAGLVTGAVTTQCSTASANIVLIQSPAAGAFVALGAAVDIWTSNGTACRAGQAKIGIRIGIGL